MSSTYVWNEGPSTRQVCTCVIFSKQIILLKRLTHHFLIEEGEIYMYIYVYTPCPEEHPAFDMKINNNYCTWNSNYIC